jgi:hypothetical protein
VTEDNVVVVDNDQEEDKDIVLVYLFIFGREIETATASFKRCHFFNSWLDETYD